MVTKKDILEIKRRFKKEECTIMRICGCYVNAEKVKVTEFSESFLNLADEEFYKYLDIVKKLFSGNIGNNILELPFPKDSENGGMQQYFMGLRESELKNPELVERLYDQIIEYYDQVGNYLILLFYDVYDVPVRTGDNMKLDESEEMFAYVLGAICPVNLSKSALGYLESDNRIGARIRDWIVDMPLLGFMFPSFAERSADVSSLTYYVKDPKDSHRTFVEEALGAGSRRTDTEQKMAVHRIIKRAVAPVMGEDETLMLNIQESLMDRIPMMVDDTGEEVRDDTVLLSKEVLLDALKENNIPGSLCDDVGESFEKAFEDEEIPAISKVIDEKKLEAAHRQRQVEELVDEKRELMDQKYELEQELVNRTFEAVAKADAPLDGESGFSQAYDVILRVKPQKVGQITARDIDGRKCVLIPLDEGEYVNLNGVNTRM